MKVKFVKKGYGTPTGYKAKAVIKKPVKQMPTSGTKKNPFRRTTRNMA